MQVGTYPTRNFALNLLPRSEAEGASYARAPSLHVAMQMGPSHHPVSWTFGVWPLRILISSALGLALAKPVAVSALPIMLSDEADREASFSVYKPNYPAKLNQPFLLIVRTVRIVTAHNKRVQGEYRSDTRVFQHIAECDPRCYQRGGQRIHLRTVIVTAAVYRGLVSLLRTEVLTTPRNLPAPGRRQPLYVVLRLSRDLCFW